MKSPDTFSVDEFVSYFHVAVERETNKKYNPNPHTIATWTRIIKRLLNDKVNVWLLALGLDTIALRWKQLSGNSPWETLSTYNLLRFFYDFKPKVPIFFWRSIWMSRFAQTDQQVEYYKEWLLQYLCAVEFRGDVGSQELKTTAHKHLQWAEDVIRSNENREATFKFHWMWEKI